MMMMMIYFLQYLMHMDFVHDDWVVMVERTKLAMMESLPMAMQQKKFGTWMRHSALCECIMESKQRCTPCTERGVVKPGKPLYMYMYVRHWSLSEANIMLHVHVCVRPFMHMLFYKRKCQACRKCDNDVFSISIYIELIMYFAYEFLYSFYNVS